jgi:hypothetical protein
VPVFVIEVDYLAAETQVHAATMPIKRAGGTQFSFRRETGKTARSSVVQESAGQSARTASGMPSTAAEPSRASWRR